MAEKKKPENKAGKKPAKATGSKDVITRKVVSNRNGKKITKIFKNGQPYEVEVEIVN